MENVKQNTMKYKILFIFSFLLVTLLLFNTNVFASYDIVYNGQTHSFNDLNKTYTYNDKTYSLSDYAHCIVTYDKHTNFFNIYYYNGTCKTYTDYSSLPYLYFSSNFIMLTNRGGKAFTICNTGSSMNERVNTIDIINSDVDIYDKTSGELVFQPPVQGNLTLAQVLEETQEEIPELTLAEIAKIVTLILAVVVSLVGFRKAWNLLGTSLNRS